MQFIMVLVAILTGVNIVLCRFLNAGSAQRNGLSMSTLMNYVVGLFTSLLVLWISAEAGGFRLPWDGISSLPVYLGGTVGVATILLSNYLTPRLPAFLLTLLIFIAQLLSALALDYLLAGDFSIGKLLGGLLVLLGLWHYQWVHKKYGVAPSQTALSAEPGTFEDR